MYVSRLLSQFFPPSPCPAVSKSSFCTSASLFLPCKEVHQYHFSGLHIYVLIYSICFSLSGFLHSLCTTGSRLIHLSSADQICSFYGWVILHLYTYQNFFTYLSLSGHLGCFHVLAIVNNAAMNIGVNVSFSIMVFLGYTHSSETAGSYGSFIPSLFFFFKESPYWQGINLQSIQ